MAKQRKKSRADKVSFSLSQITSIHLELHVETVMWSMTTTDKLSASDLELWKRITTLLNKNADKLLKGLNDFT